MQNGDIAKCILMAASKDGFILETFLHGCFSKGSCKHIFILEITHILHFLLWRHVKEEQIFMIFFLSKIFDEKCKHKELALNFVQKQYFR